MNTAASSGGPQTPDSKPANFMASKHTKHTTVLAVGVAVCSLKSQSNSAPNPFFKLAKTPAMESIGGAIQVS